MINLVLAPLMGQDRDQLEKVAFQLRRIKRGGGYR